jgi:hypothetical protein
VQCSAAFGNTAGGGGAAGDVGSGASFVDSGNPLTSADFSQTDISKGNAIFGDQALIFDKTASRPSFRATVMNCEFVAQWKQLDLTGANIYSGVNFDNLDLNGSRWTGAVLEHASFQNATSAAAGRGAGGWKRSMCRMRRCTTATRCPTIRRRDTCSSSSTRRIRRAAAGPQCARR